LIEEKRETVQEERDRKKQAFRRRLERHASAMRYFEDDFTLGYEIGSGSFATVYKAHGIHSEVTRAVKVISLTGSEKDAIANELHTLLLLDHPHVLALHTWYETSMDIKLVTELCSGTIADIRTPQPLEVARPIFRPIFSALTYAHARGFIHRDMKPGNVLFTENRTVKVADWGLSIRLRNGETPKTTQGTLYYLAPEILVEPYTSSFEADIWSTGIMLYMFLHDHHPFLGQDGGNNPRMSYTQLLRTHSHRLRPIRPMDADMRSLIEQCLETEPAQRPKALSCWKSTALEEDRAPLGDTPPLGSLIISDGEDGKRPARRSKSCSSTTSESTSSVKFDVDSSPTTTYRATTRTRRPTTARSLYFRGSKLSMSLQLERRRHNPALETGNEHARSPLPRTTSMPLEPKRRGARTIAETLKKYCRTLDEPPPSSIEDSKAAQDAVREELLYYDTEAYSEYYMNAVNERGVLEVHVDGKTYVLAYSEFVHAMSMKLD